MPKGLFFLSVVFCLLFLLPTDILSYYTNMPASVVVGQGDFTTTTAGTTQNTLNGPADVMVDPLGRLILVEISNNRVLIWNKVPTTNGKSADLVLGQADFVSGASNRGGSRGADTLAGPTGIFSDGNKLYVADSENNRVLIWNTFPTQNGQAADVVVGQSTMQAAGVSCNTLGISQSYDVAVYNNKLIVSAPGSRRVSIWNSVPITNGVTADVVVGKADFSDCSTATTTQSNITRPRNLNIDKDGRLYVVDDLSSRILVWNSIPTTNGTPADLVIGQPDFTTSSSGVTASKINSGRGIYTNNTRLFLPDSTNNRVLVFNSIPTSNGASADLVLGQSDFTSSSANGGRAVSANGLSAPGRVYEYSNKLYVSEFSNNRILIFNNILSNPHLSISKTEQLSGDSGKLKISGSVELGERGRYFLSSVKASVNGIGYGDVTYKDGGRDNGVSSTLYEFNHEFEPWTNNNGDKNTWRDRGYTVALKAISSNAEEDEIFMFSPFNLNKVTSTTLEFSVPSKHWSTLVDKLSSYAIEMKKPSENEWKRLYSDIPVSTTTNTFKDFTVSHNSTTGTVTVTPKSTLLSGEYRVLAISKSGNTFGSNTVSYSFGIQSYKPDLTVTDSWFPLQINKISGVESGIISSFTSYVPKVLRSSTLTPVIQGVAPRNADVHLLVTNTKKPGEKRDYIIETGNSTSFSMPITMYDYTTLDMWVRDANNLTVLPSLAIVRNGAQILKEYFAGAW